MIVHITLALGLYSAGFYFVYSANVNGLSTSNTAGMMLNFMFLGPFKLLNIVSTARPFNRSRTARPFDRSRTARPFDCSRETFSKDKRKS